MVARVISSGGVTALAVKALHGRNGPKVSAESAAAKGEERICGSKEKRKDEFQSVGTAERHHDRYEVDYFVGI
jgi:hypothetical protein